MLCLYEAETFFMPSVNRMLSYVWYSSRVVYGIGCDLLNKWNAVLEKLVDN